MPYVTVKSDWGSTYFVGRTKLSAEEYSGSKIEIEFPDGTKQETVLNFKTVHGSIYDHGHSNRTVEYIPEAEIEVFGAKINLQLYPNNKQFKVKLFK